MRRAIRVGATLAVGMVAWLWLVWPTSLGGQTSYVTTQGISMEPRIHTGDLAVVRTAGAYRVGDVVAYRSDLLETVVLHRITSIDAGRYTFKGDNNSWLDPEHPGGDAILGALAVTIPRGGVWLSWASNPVTVGVCGFLILVAGADTSARRRRRARSTATPTPTAKPARPRSDRPDSRWGDSLRVRSAALQGLAVVAIGAGVLGVLLGCLAWLAPRTDQAPGAARTHGSMSFSYSASVPATPAYDGTTVTSPDPVFRRLASIVEVQFSYRGEPGVVRVDARLSSSGGWRSMMPLQGPTVFSASAFTGWVRLDLAAIDARAQAAAAVTGIPAGEVRISVVAAVTRRDGSTFVPALKLTLGPLQLALDGDAKGLTVTDGASLQTTPPRSARSIALLGRPLGVGTAFRSAALLVAVALLLGVLLAVLVWRAPRLDETAWIRRRYGALLVRTEPLVVPPERSVVDVVRFATLASLAERYGLLVLHWALDGVAVFVVWDHAAVYRYRTQTGADREGPDIGRAGGRIPAQRRPGPGPRRAARATRRISPRSAPASALADRRWSPPDRAAPERTGWERLVRGPGDR